MSTTAIIVEHLISGLRAAIWLTLLILTLLGYDWLELNHAKDFAAQISFVALALVYPIGIFIDEVADFLFAKWSEKIRAKRFQCENVNIDVNTVSAFQILHVTKDDFLRSYFNYIRMRIRISRSAALNFFACSMTALAFTVFRTAYSWKLLATELIVGCLLTFLAIWAWYRVSDIFAKQVSRAYKEHNNLS